MISPAFSGGDVYGDGDDLVIVAVVTDYVDGHLCPRVVPGDQPPPSFGVSLDDFSGQHRIDDVFAAESLFMRFP
jgi:hypothetical protein